MKLNRPGISSAFLQAAGVHWVEEPEPELRIPYHDRQGRLPGHYQSRLQYPRNGQKYTQPAGSNYEVYFSHLPLTTCQRLWLSEGEFKALCLIESGEQTLGLGGLACYEKDEQGQPTDSACPL